MNSPPKREILHLCDNEIFQHILLHYDFIVIIRKTANFTTFQCNKGARPHERSTAFGEESFSSWHPASNELCTGAKSIVYLKKIDSYYQENCKFYNLPM